MNVSQAGRALIERNEGCVLHAYADIVGVLTIGYGHIEGVRPGQTITQAQADQMLSDDLDTIYGPKVGAALHGAPTTQPQFDAMVSLAYNVGTGNPATNTAGFAGSTVCRKHRAGDYAGAAAAFAAWNKAGGKVVPALTRRRREEAELYLSAAAKPAQPIPDADNPDWHIREAQRLLGVPVDGDFGPISHKAAAEWLAAHPE